MLKLMFKLNKIITVLNKYLYILPLITIIINNLSYFKDNQTFKFIIRIIKILIILSIVLSGLVVLYFTDFTSPMTNTYSLYQDLLDPYIEFIKNIWNKLINIIKYYSPGESTTTQIESKLESVISQVKDEVKLGIKEGIKETVGEILEELQEETVNSNTNLYKNIALTASGLFLFYFLFALPSSPVSPEELASYNWFNQSLIEFKITVLNLFSGPSNPGNPGNSPLSNAGAILTPSTPSSPVLSSTSSELTEVPRLKQYVEASTQTILDSLTVSRNLEAVNLMIDHLDKETSNQIADGTVKIIKTITD